MKVSVAKKRGYFKPEKKHNYDRYYMKYAPIKFSDLEEEAINKGIEDFIKKGIVEPVVLADASEFIF